MTLSESTLSSVLDFDSIDAILARLNGILEASEFHGALCGYLCAGKRFDKNTWCRQTIELLEIESLSETEELDVYRFYQIGFDQLGDPDYSFQLLLPSDDENIRIRLEQLVHWCEGFLSAYGDAEKQALSTDLEHILQDLIAISQAELDVDENEENESHYMELVEFVRMAVLNIFLGAIQPGDSPNSKAPPLQH